jgi:excisionase family DNA binding protein
VVHDELTLQEAAELLGVHYMTAYRYVRLGLLPAEKSGGTWRVERQAVDEFRARAASVATLPTRGERAGRRAPWADRLEQRLVAGDGRGAWGVVEAALSAGADLDEVYLDVLAPALTSIGARWERGEIDVAVEHMASGIAMRIIGRLGPRFTRRGRSRGTVVLGAPSGERHGLPVALLADLVRQAGWDVRDLGADTPPSSFAHAALHADDVVAVGVSVTTAEALPTAEAALRALREAVPAVHLVIGGRAVVDEAHAHALGADAWASDGRTFVTLLDVLTGRSAAGDVAHG